jgi:hypothetical protein
VIHSISFLEKKTQDEAVSALDKYRLNGRVRRTIKAAQMIEKERPRASVSKP